MNHPLREKPIEILLVEDSPSDAQLAIEALQSAKIANRLSHVEDGVEALQFLRREGPYPTPRART
jgi:CheY-like chemotaxis protein